MKLIVSTVREFKAEDRKELIETLCAVHRARGDNQLADRMAPLATETDRVEIKDGSREEREWVQTVYEIVP